EPVVSGLTCSHRTIFPFTTVNFAAASCPGPSHLWPGRCPRTNVAVATLPFTRSLVIRPAQGRLAFHSVAILRVGSWITLGPWIVTALRASNAPAALSLPALSALLQARTTCAGVFGRAAFAVPRNVAATSAATAIAVDHLPIGFAP